MAWGAAWTDSGRIFTKEDGNELTPDWVSEHFERLAFAAGLPPIRLHDLRHGAATLSLAGNDIKTTSAMLRHSSLSITADLYTTVLPEVAREAAEASALLVPRAVIVGEASETGGLPSMILRGLHVAVRALATQETEPSAAGWSAVLLRLAYLTNANLRHFRTAATALVKGRSSNR
ncbi:tyrosine-type recombinase/integrase [Nonomuraea glycinis]|uniref:tyrosine-type recombinase/integrase n=1 Tax=Nonomuraea glycinis TaxID=2047744 RepID=UPI002E0FA2D7|nr:tyrosine-type recombinase/integrase [Nonomuraea glycinis]